MNKKRLTILRDALIEHAKNPGNLRFDLSNWALLPEGYQDADPTSAVRKACLGENFCGTSACAMGIAASLPEFNKLGLRLEGGFWGAGEADIVYRSRRTGETFRDGIEAAVALFQISEEDAFELFLPEMYRRADRKNPLAVADKITALLETA